MPDPRLIALNDLLGDAFSNDELADLAFRLRVE